MHVATFLGNESIVQMLPENGADANSHGGEHGNALQTTTYFKDENIIRLLLENGADMNSQGSVV